MANQRFLKPSGDFQTLVHGRGFRRVSQSMRRPRAPAPVFSPNCLTLLRLRACQTVSYRCLPTRRCFRRLHLASGFAVSNKTAVLDRGHLPRPGRAQQYARNARLMLGRSCRKRQHAPAARRGVGTGELVEDAPKARSTHDLIGLFASRKKVQDAGPRRVNEFFGVLTGQLALRDHRAGQVNDVPHPSGPPSFVLDLFTRRHVPLPGVRLKRLHGVRPHAWGSGPAA